MTVVAIYNMKGGVGKTSLAVNMAWAAATVSGLRTLLWDLDPQAASTFILADAEAEDAQARQVLEGRVDPRRLIRRTATERLDLLPSDSSLRNIDGVFARSGGDRPLPRILDALRQDYDCFILDCPPGLELVSEQIIASASMILVPMIPSGLSSRACDEVCDYVGEQHGDAGPPIFPVFTMVDRRRSAHRTALEEEPGFPVIPMASAVEQMAARHAPVGEYAPRSAAATAFADLWRLVEPLVAGKTGRRKRAARAR